MGRQLSRTATASGKGVLLISQSRAGRELWRQPAGRQHCRRTFRWSFLTSRCRRAARVEGGFVYRWRDMLFVQQLSAAKLRAGMMASGPRWDSGKWSVPNGAAVQLLITGCFRGASHSSVHFPAVNLFEAMHTPNWTLIRTQDVALLKAAAPHPLLQSADQGRIHSALGTLTPT